MLGSRARTYAVPETVRAAALDPVERVTRAGNVRVALVVKRALDVVGATIGLLLSIPIIGLASVAIAVKSRGAVLYHQTRVGRGGRRFRVHKLRTMRVGNDDAQHAAYVAALIAGDGYHDGALFELGDDSRCTRVGRFLRRTSIDELPQLWNVLRGDMSLVGPRPSTPRSRT